ncbi:MAG TPA: chemotaxis protein CheW [Polyangia bacterium]|nr:chemotaxis protein CheW [Polyangia bacterium]
MTRRSGTLESSIERVLGELRREYWRSIESAPTDEPMTEQVLLMSSGGELYALHAGQAREVARPGDIVPLPGAPDRLAGVTNVRGQAVPVLDLRRVIEGRPSDLGPSARLVTLRSPLPIAILVEAVSDLVEVAMADLLGAIQVAPAEAGGDGRPARGTLTVPGGLEARLLDVDRLIELASGQS